MSSPYQVFIDDNFHYMDEDERYKLGDFETFEEALAACRGIVNRSLEEYYKDGMSAGELYQNYTGFGDDPFIVAEIEPPFRFSAWDYAKQRCREICKDEG